MLIRRKQKGARLINQLIATTLPHLPKRLVQVFSRSYIAGETVDDAMAVSQRLNNDGIKTTIDILGEFVTSLDEADRNRKEYIELIETATQHGIDGSFSVKPTMFGLLINPEACFGYIRPIVQKAAEYDNFICIDMEDSSCVDLEINLFRKLKSEFPQNVGLVVQAYLKRTKDDLKRLSELHSQDVPLNFRLCKGIYVEPPDIAFQKNEEINRHFLNHLEYMFEQGFYAAIATHDKHLVKRALDLIDIYDVPKTKYEFQMLYGVTHSLRKSICDQGHTMRVYVPYGSQWFGYSTRRLKENPKIISYVVKSFILGR